MAKESFLLVSLNESKAKELAQVVSNESCRKILDYLAAKKDATESEISQKLNIPISTVHYNLQLLVGAKLVTADEYHYSTKGKEVNHYSLANKYIIIAPKTVWGIKEKLKTVLPVLLIAGAISGALKVFLGTRVMTFGTVAEKAAVIPAYAMAGECLMAAGDEAVAGVPALFQNFALWFLFGAVFATILYLIFDWIRKG